MDIDNNWQCLSILVQAGELEEIKRIVGQKVIEINHSRWLELHALADIISENPGGGGYKKHLVKELKKNLNSLRFNSILEEFEVTQVNYYYFIYILMWPFSRTFYLTALNCAIFYRTYVLDLISNHSVKKLN